MNMQESHDGLNHLLLPPLLEVSKLSGGGAGGPRMGEAGFTATWPSAFTFCTSVSSL